MTENLPIFHIVFSAVKPEGDGVRVEAEAFLCEALDEIEARMVGENMIRERWPAADGFVYWEVKVHPLCDIEKGLILGIAADHAQRTAEADDFDKETHRGHLRLVM